MAEIWLKHDETKSTIADISSPGYSIFHKPHADQRAGGGIGILVSDQLKLIFILHHHLKRSKRSLKVWVTIHSVVLLSVCIGFKTVDVNFFRNFKIF